MRYPEWTIWLFPTSTLLGFCLAGVAIVADLWLLLAFGTALVVAPLALAFMEE